MLKKLDPKDLLEELGFAGCAPTSENPLLANFREL
jgi:hypothetical protein